MSTAVILPFKRPKRISRKIAAGRQAVTDLQAIIGTLQAVRFDARMVKRLADVLGDIEADVYPECYVEPAMFLSLADERAVARRSKGWQAIVAAAQLQADAEIDRQLCEASS